jgi:hypothetical protein
MLGKHNSIYKLNTDLNQLNPNLFINNEGSKFITSSFEDKFNGDYGVSILQLENNEVINNTVIAQQKFYKMQHPKSVLLSNNKILTMWHSDRADGSGNGIFGKIQNLNNLSENNIDNNDGVFRINDHIANNQELQQIIVLDNSNFVTVWQSMGQDCKQMNNGIYAKIFDENANVTVPEFRVNSYTHGNQEKPSIAKLADGSFIITWQSYNQDGNGYGIYARHFTSSGIPLGEEFQVNDSTINDQENASVHGLSNGGYIICWQANHEDIQKHNIYAKIYDAEGIVVSNEFKVSSETQMNHKSPRVIGLKEGNFAIAWEVKSKSSKGTFIYLKKYTNNGIELSTEVQVNENTSINVALSHIAATDNNIILVTWTDESESNKLQIAVQEFANEIEQPETPSVQETQVEQPSLPPTTNVTDQVITQSTTDINEVAPVTVSPIPITTDITNSNIAPVSTEVNVAPTTEQVTDIITNVVAPQEPLVATSTELTESASAAPTIVSTEIAPSTEGIIQTTEIPTVVTASPEIQNNQPTEPVITTLLPNVGGNNNPLTVVVHPIPIASLPAPSSSLMNITYAEVLVIANNTNFISSNGSFPLQYIIPSAVKNLTIECKNESHSFIFSQSENSLIQINGFGDNAILNFTNFANYSSYSDLNVTRGSTHLHFAHNQTIIIKNKYPEDLKDKNFIFIGNQSSSNPHQRENDQAHSIEPPQTKSDTALILGLSLGSLALLGTAGVLGGVLIYKYRESVVKATKVTGEKVVSAAGGVITYITDHLPYGKEDDNDINVEPTPVDTTTASATPSVGEAIEQPLQRLSSNIMQMTEGVLQCTEAMEAPAYPGPGSVSPSHIVEITPEDIIRTPLDGSISIDSSYPSPIGYIRKLFLDGEEDNTV